MSYQETDQAVATRERVFEFVVAYKKEHDGNSPSLREIADACHIVVSGAYYHLSRLELDNRVRISGPRSRTIEIVGATWSPPEGEHPEVDAATPHAPETRAGKNNSR